MTAYEIVSTILAVASLMVAVGMFVVALHKASRRT
jgi:hypothetical protein